MFEIKERTKVGMSIFGQTLEVTMPSLKAISKMQEDLKDQDSVSIEVFGEFLNKCGIPQEITDELEMEHVDKLVAFLCGSKKN